MATPDTESGITLVVRRTFEAPREKVFQAWTAPEELKKWFGPEGVACPEAEVDLRPGGRYRIAYLKPEGDTVRVGGVFQEVQPPEKLDYTWEWESGDSAGMGETLVTVEFRDQKGSTELTLTHERFPNEEKRDHHGMGWNSTLDCLVKFLA